MKERFDIRSYVWMLVVVGLAMTVSCGRTDSEGAPKSSSTLKQRSGGDAIGLPEIGPNPLPRDVDKMRRGNVGYYRKMFNDSNKYQYAYAEYLGIEPIVTLSDAYDAKRPLVHIETCDDYAVDDLTHSMPYLVPEGADLLAAIGRNFRDSLAVRGLDGYKIKVTSLLRTPRHVKKLRRVNVNATDSSTHQFGTTFDISWSNYIETNPKRSLGETYLKSVLGEVLLDLRERGRCMVKYEHKTCCFHITATK